MGLLDMAALVLFVMLLYRLRDNYLEGKAGKKAGAAGQGHGGSSTSSSASASNLSSSASAPTGQAAGEQAAVDDLRLLGAQAAQSQVTVGVFAALLVCLVLPVLFGGGSGTESAETAAQHAGVLAFQLDSKESLEQALEAFGSAPQKQFLLGMVDVGQTGDAAAAERGRDFARAVAELGRKGVIMAGAGLGTFNNPAYYSARHLAIDSELEQLAGVSRGLQLHVTHGFGSRGTAAHVEEAARACFADSARCTAVLEEEVAPGVAVNGVVRAALRETPRARCEGSPASPSLAPSSEQTEADVAAAAAAANRDWEDDELASAARSAEGPGFLKRSMIWATRLLGFVYPFHETYVSLKNREDRAGQWRAYWTIYAMVHFLEDSLFIGLVYLMPIYLLLKVCFLAWCLYPDPRNSLEAYNALVRTVAERKGKSKTD